MVSSGEGAGDVLLYAEFEGRRTRLGGGLLAWRVSVSLAEGRLGEKARREASWRVECRSVEPVLESGGAETAQERIGTKRAWNGGRRRRGGTALEHEVCTWSNRNRSKDEIGLGSSW